MNRLILLIGYSIAFAGVVALYEGHTVGSLCRDAGRSVTSLGRYLSFFADLGGSISDTCSPGRR